MDGPLHPDLSRLHHQEAVIPTETPGTARPPRAVPSSDEAARALVNGYIATLLGSSALKAGLRKSLRKLQSKLQ